jgi:hypothetical protein
VELGTSAQVAVVVHQQVQAHIQVATAVVVMVQVQEQSRELTQQPTQVQAVVAVVLPRVSETQTAATALQDL